MVEQQLSSHFQSLPNAACPECGKGCLVLHLIDEVFDFDLGEETIRVQAHNVPVERCDQCGAELSGLAAAQVRHEAVCRAAGFFTPEEIQSLRQRLNLSQQDFARLAGVGVNTVSRWERGRLIQTRCQDDLLFLLSASAEARQLLQERIDSPPQNSAAAQMAVP